jgi:hypothetical protein
LSGEADILHAISAPRSSSILLRSDRGAKVYGFALAAAITVSRTTSRAGVLLWKFAALGKGRFACAVSLITAL